MRIGKVHSMNRFDRSIGLAARIVSAMFLLGCAAFAFGQCPSAQQTTVSFTLTDSDTQLWIGAKVTANLYNPSSTQKPLCASTNQTFPISVTATTNGSGVGSMVLTGNGAITPVGTRWIFTIQSQTSAPPTITTPLLIQTGGSQSLNSALDAQLVAPRFFTTVFGAYGYLVGETMPIPCVDGSQWLNVVLDQYQICNGGTYGPVSASIDIQVNGVNLINQMPAVNFVQGSGTTITNPTLGNIDISSSGGGILPPNPSTTNYVVVGDSRNQVDNTNVASPIVVTAASCTTSICTMTATNTLAAGDIIAINTTFSPSFLTGGGVGTNPYYYPVLSAGLSSSQFEIANPVPTSSGSGTGGTILSDSSYLWPFQMAKLPYFNGHGTVQLIAQTAGETVAGISAQYTTFIHPFSPAVTGNPGFLFIEAGYADTLTAACGSIPGSVESAYQSLWATAHADGFKVIQLSIPSNATDGTETCGLPLQQVIPWFNEWLVDQSISKATVASGEYWDYFMDAAAVFNGIDANLIAPGQSPHFSDVAHGLIAKVANDTMLNNSALKKSQCNGTDFCPNLYTQNDFINQSQRIDWDGSKDRTGWQLLDSTGRTAQFGYRNHDTIFPTFSWQTNDSAVNDFFWFYENGGSTVAGMVYNGFFPIMFSTPGDDSNPPDVSIFRDNAVANTIDIGSAANLSNDKTGNLQMAGIGIGTAHVSGHAFDCSGLGCPSVQPAWTAGVTIGLSTGAYYSYSCTVNGTGETCYHESINTGLLNNASTTTVSLLHALPTGILGDPICSDNSSRVQSGNTQPVGANFIGGTAPYTTFSVWVGATSENAQCTVDGY